VHGLRASFTCGVWQRQVASQVRNGGDDLRPKETSSVTDTLFVASYNHHHHQAQYVKLFRIVFKTKHVPACCVDQQVKKDNQTEMESFADPRSGVRKRLRELVEK
jgi:hypothetical protein